MIKHEYTSLAVYDEAHHALDMWAIEFAVKGLIREHTLVPIEGSPAGAAFTAGRAMRFTRRELDSMPAEIVSLLRAEGIDSVCSAPMLVHDRRLGTLTIGRAGGEPFTDDDEELLASVANQVAVSVENALAFQEIAALKDKLSAEKAYLEEEIRTDHNFEEIVGRSDALQRVLHQVEHVAPTDATVLILGETGTGKELIARAIHNLSGRRERTFVKRELRRDPRGLARERAVRPRARRVHRRHRAAHRPLRARRRRHAVPRRDRRPAARSCRPSCCASCRSRSSSASAARARMRVDVRVVAATNRNLADAVAAGAFRRTSTTGSTSSRSRCRRCASAARTSRTWSATSCSASRGA